MYHFNQSAPNPTQMHLYLKIHSTNLESEVKLNCNTHMFQIIEAQEAIF